ncbi:helix-turn-helix transcriptional regulator [Leptospira kmetyi]|uniref:helix-turn-helix transcriptional regulator n=1 Tax=Leptospira kmetyi TaxID=408139 RepID=UPI001FAFA1BA|nr:helix-turn-helix transcriptional regulator [Leptospira kmetyi]
MDFSTFKKKLGNRIKELRLEHGLTQEDLDIGDDGVPYRTVQNIEGGKSNTNLRTLYRLGKIFQINPKELLNFEEPKPKKKHKISEEEIKALHRYFKNADLLKRLFNEATTKFSMMGSIDKFFEAKSFMELWYASLYTVLEGAVFELNIKDPPFGNIYDYEKDKWKHDFPNTLRKYRNNLSHYQRDIDTEIRNSSKDLSIESSWAKALHESIEEYFRKEMKSRKSN